MRRHWSLDFCVNARIHADMAVSGKSRRVVGVWLRVAMLVVLAVAGCSDSTSEESSGEQYNGPFELEGPTGKADNAGIPGISTQYDSSDTQVWAVRNQWEDRNTTEAKKEGMAWP